MASTLMLLDGWDESFIVLKVKVGIPGDREDVKDLVP